MKKTHTFLIAATIGAVVVAAQPSFGHFLWLVPVDDSTVDVYFSETAEPGSPGLLDRVADARVRRFTIDGILKDVPVEKTSESLRARTKSDQKAVFLLHFNYGIAGHGGRGFLLHYYAKTGEVFDNSFARARSALDLKPETEGSDLRLSVLWHDKPISQSQVVIVTPDGERIEKTSNDSGQISFAPKERGLYSIRARHIEAREGVADGKEYSEVRHYATLALNLPVVAKGVAAEYADLPQPVTSLGAAIVADSLYVYGGHIGKAHSYSTAEQSGSFWRLDLKGKKGWKKLGSGPKMQGMAMVAYGGKLYRLGGFTARNAEGDAHDLWSRADVDRYDPSTGAWTEMPSMPMPRSSFDAVVMDDTIYVIGGWKLIGGDEQVWHDTAYALDLSKPEPEWTALPKQPFYRRALSLAAHEGKIYAIGGMSRDDGPSTRVDIFDPSTGEWSRGPSIQGEPMEGFGNSALAIGGRLYTSTIRGNLQRLTADGSAWEIDRELDTARFFHRMLPLDDHRLLFVGGANMSIGKFEQVEVIRVD